MWTLTPDNLAQVKNALSERRAAVTARYTAELGAIDTDLEEIATLERVAHSFSMKHLPETDVRQLVTAESEAGITALVSVSESRTDPIAATATEPAPEKTEPRPIDTTVGAVTAANTSEPPHRTPPMRPDKTPKGSSLRWRIRIPSESDTATSNT
jgi:hypothetical protein